MLDRDEAGVSYGCSRLRARVEQLDLRLHCFGHMHASAAVLAGRPTISVNAAAVCEGRSELRPPVVIDL